MSTGTRVLTRQGTGIIIGWKGLFVALVSLADGRVVEVEERELRLP